MDVDFADTAPMHTRASDDLDTGIKVNRVVPLWGIILIVGAGMVNIVQSWNAQQTQASSIIKLEASVTALTVKLDGILTSQNSANLADAQHDLKIGYINDQITNLRNRLASVENVLPRQYQPQTIIQMPAEPPTITRRK